MGKEKSGEVGHREKQKPRDIQETDADKHRYRQI